MSTNAAIRFNNELRYRDPDHPAQTQFTPSYIMRHVRSDLGLRNWAGDERLGLDPCTTANNPLRAEVFYTIEDDGLAQPWHREDWRPTVFVNPPYGKAREPWIKRCIEAGSMRQPVILLIPAATDTRIFQRAAATATAVVFVKGRIKFGILRPNRRQVAASHPSALIGWNTDLRHCRQLGWYARPVREVLAASSSEGVAVMAALSPRGGH